MQSRDIILLLGGLYGSLEDYMTDETSLPVQTQRYFEKRLRFIRNIPSATHNRSILERYVFAILISILMSSLQLLVAHSIGQPTSYFWPFVGVIASILYGGFGAGVMSIAISTLISSSFFLLPHLTL